MYFRLTSVAFEQNAFVRRLGVKRFEAVQVSNEDRFSELCIGDRKPGVFIKTVPKKRTLDGALVNHVADGTSFGGNAVYNNDRCSFSKPAAY